MNQSLYLVIVLFLSLKYLYAQQQNDSIKTINEILISYQANNRTPVTYLDISSQKLNQLTIGQEPSFILASTPSIANYSDAGSSQGYSYFRLRGIDQTRINLTLDGVPISEPEDQGGYFSNYTDILNSVSKIQIQRGVGTTKNGIASYGGSVQLFSPNLADTTQTTFGINYGSYNSFRVYAEHNSGIKNNKAIYARISQLYSDGYKYNSSNNSQSFFISSGLFYEKSTWKLNILGGQQRNQTAWLGVSEELIKKDRRTNANTKEENDRFFQSIVQLQNTRTINENASLQSSIYYIHLNGNYNFDYNNFAGLPSTNDLLNYAFLSNLVGIFSNYTYSRNTFNWTTGIHANTYNRRHTGSDNNVGQLYRNTGYKKDFSAFTKIDYYLNDFTFFTDLQYRFTTFNYKGSVPFNSIDWHFFNPKVGVNYTFNPHHSIYYNIGSTHREPTRNDMFGGNDNLVSTPEQTPFLFNTKAESVIDYEIGYRYNSSKLQFSFNGYYMDFKNEIVLNGQFGPNGLALTNNVEKSFRAGVELSLQYQLCKNFTFNTNSSFNYSQIKEKNETFNPILSPKLILNNEISYTINNFSISLTSRYQDSSYIDFANTNQIKGFHVLNSRIKYQLNKLNITLFINNLTNTKYYSNGYVDIDGTNKYFVQAPFNTNLSLQYSF